MKDWFKYIVAAVAGLALVIILPDTESAQYILSSGAEIFQNIGTYLLVPFVLISFSSGIAALRRQKQAAGTLFYTLMWGVIASVALTLVGGLVAWVVIPANFSGVAGTASVSAVELPAFPDFLQGIFNRNFFALFVSPTALLPATVLALLLGIVLRPNEDYIRPAFAVMNSFSEVFYRLAAIVTEIMILGVVFISAVWFGAALTSGVIQDSMLLVVLLLTATALAVFLILPLLLLFIGKTRKPFTWLFALTAPAIIGWFSGSAYTAHTTLMLHTRSNLGAAKRVSSTSAPLLLILGRSGTAMISVITICSLYATVNGEALKFVQLLLAMVFSVLFSFTVSLTPGLEILLVVTMSGKLLGIDLASSLPIILPMLPFLAGAAALVDTVSAGFGAGSVSRIQQAHSPVKARDFL